jgi:hypothetical protein
MACNRRHPTPPPPLGPFYIPYTIGCPRFAYLLDYLSVSLRLYFLEGTGGAFCHLRVSRRFEVELAARRPGTKNYVSRI